MQIDNTLTLLMIVIGPFYAIGVPVLGWIVKKLFDVCSSLDDVRSDIKKLDKHTDKLDKRIRENHDHIVDKVPNTHNPRPFCDQCIRKEEKEKDSHDS